MDLPHLLTPAIAAGVFAYLVNFFGKIISDQMPVVDERKWHIQLNGMMFMTNMLTGLIGVYFAFKFPWGVGHWWLHLVTFIVLGIVWAALSNYGKSESSKFYNYRKKHLAEESEKSDGVTMFLASLGKHIGVVPLPILLFYFGTLEYLSGNIYWLIVTPVVIFLMFVQSAFNFSFKSLKDIQPVTIYFIDKNITPLTNVYVLKEREDSYRLRIEDKIVLINKNEILKMEMIIPEHLH